VSTDPVGVLSLAAVLAGLWRLIGRHQWADARVHFRRLKIRRTATTPVAQCVAGTIVKITGRIEAVAALTEAPLTARAAVATLTCLDVVDGRKDSPTHYVRDQRIDDFIVRDDSGSALVRARRAQIVTDLVAFTPDEARKQQWMRRWRAHERFLGVFARPLRYYEVAAEPGATVSALGTCVERSGADGHGPYREAAEATITIDAVILDW
jgi:hypothetical protein